MNNLFCLKIVYYMKTLDKVKKGKWCKITGIISVEDKAVFRLCEMGFVDGEKIKVQAISPAKKVMLLQVRGVVLSVRVDLLKNVQVQDV